MATQEFVFTPNSILKPLFEDALNHLSPIKLAPGTYAAGQSLGRQVGGLGAAFNTSNSDGTQVWAGFNQIACSVDVSGNHYLQSGTGAGAANYFSAPSNYVNMYDAGVFSPNDVTTNSTTAAEVDTFTPANPTAGDVYTLSSVVNGVANSVNYTVGSTATVAAVSAGLLAAWNGNAATSAVAAASGGTNSVVLTAVTTNTLMNVSGSVAGTGTIAKAVMTAAGGRSLADIQTGAPGARVMAQYGAYRIP